MSEKKYWKSFGELNLTESYMKETENEFQEDLPMESWMTAKACWMQNIRAVIS